jgi:hypothetical protein
MDPQNPQITQIKTESNRAVACLLLDVNLCNLCNLWILRILWIGFTAESAAGGVAQSQALLSADPAVKFKV